MSSQREALQVVGLSRSTWHYRTKPRPRVNNPVPQKDRNYSRRISDADRAIIEQRIRAGWRDNLSVAHSFAKAWDEGVMVGSLRSWWRISDEIGDQSARPKVATSNQTRRPRPAPVLVATGPGQVWSWDITDLKSVFSRVAFKMYSIVDIYSRKIVGYRVEQREVNHLAVEMFEKAIATYGAPACVHADSGAAMKSNALHDALQAHGVKMTHNRPYVSNDNPYSEAGFRTMKYRPDYPGVFATLNEARQFIDGYVAWYNTTHRHSGIALFTPDQVHDGTWKEAFDKREHAAWEYYTQHPERFNAPPKVPTIEDTVGINHKLNQQETNKSEKAA